MCGPPAASLPSGATVRGGHGCSVLERECWLPVGERTEPETQGMTCWMRQAPLEAGKLNQQRGDLVLGRASKQPSRGRCPSITLKATPLLHHGAESRGGVCTPISRGLAEHLSPGLSLPCCANTCLTGPHQRPCSLNPCMCHPSNFKSSPMSGLGYDSPFYR